MRAEAQAHIEQINAATALLRRFLDWDRALKRLDELNARVEDPTLWDDPKAAQEVMRERRRLDEAIGATRTLERELADTSELIELAESEGDDALVEDGIRSLAELAERADRDKVAALLAGEADANNAYVEINAGAGGTESQDWAEMLLRMYSRWGERHGFRVEMIDHHSGEQAGIKSATILVKGENAYGNLKVESGVHRLVRISPYDANARRHTSFSSVWVYPEVDDDIDIQINESELRIDTYRASGAGGQHVNTTDFFFSSRRRHTRWNCDWSSDVCSSDLREACARPDGSSAHLKVIFETGELQTYDNVRRVSWLAMMAGAHFIKTSTGKIQPAATRSEEHTSELQSQFHLVCRLLLEKKKKK